jgi:hypothetical protein
MVSSSYIIPQIESSWPLLSSHALLKDQLIEIMCTLFDDDAFKLLLDIIKKTPPEEIRSSPLKHRLIYSKNVEIHYYQFQQFIREILETGSLNKEQIDALSNVLEEISKQIRDRR